MGQVRHEKISFRKNNANHCVMSVTEEGGRSDICSQKNDAEPREVSQWQR